MLLAIDVGNTQTHLGAFEGAELAEHWRFRTVSGATGDEIAERIAGLLALSGIELDDDRCGRASPRSCRRWAASTRRWRSATSTRRA